MIDRFFKWSWIKIVVTFISRVSEWTRQTCSTLPAFWTLWAFQTSSSYWSWTTCASGWTGRTWTTWNKMAYFLMFRSIPLQHIDDESHRDILSYNNQPWFSTAANLCWIKKNIKLKITGHLPLGPKGPIIPRGPRFPVAPIPPVAPVGPAGPVPPVLPLLPWGPVKPREPKPMTMNTHHITTTLIHFRRLEGSEGKLHLLFTCCSSSPSSASCSEFSSKTSSTGWTWCTSRSRWTSSTGCTRCPDFTNWTSCAN